jgi:hypothetical protein
MLKKHEKSGYSPVSGSGNKWKGITRCYQFIESSCDTEEWVVAGEVAETR